MRNGQATPIPRGGNLSRSMTSSSLPFLPILSDHFYDIVDIANPMIMQVESVRTENLVQTHCMDQEEMKTLSREWNLRN